MYHMEDGDCPEIVAHIIEKQFNSSVFHYEDLNGVTFTRCKFNSVVFSHCKFDETTFRSCDFNDCTFVDTKSAKYLAFPACTFVAVTGVLQVPTFDTRGYSPVALLIGGKFKIVAGCRYFTLDNAVKHWSRWLAIHRREEKDGNEVAEIMRCESYVQSIKMIRRNQKKVRTKWRKQSTYARRRAIQIYGKGMYAWSY